MLFSVDYAEDDDDEIFDAALFDISDVEVTLKSSRSRKQVTIVLDSESDFNLMKTYLALKDYIEQMERSLNILEAAPTQLSS